jgi:hypothetical protein
VGHKIPSKRLLTFKRDSDLTFTLKYDDEVTPYPKTYTLAVKPEPET